MPVQAMGRLLVIAVTVCSVARAPALAATSDECTAMGDDLLAAKKSHNDDRALDVSTRIVSECDSLGIATLAEHFHEIGQDGLALGTADACVQTYPQELLCWLTKGAQHVHLRQAKEAQKAYRQALILAKEPAEKQKIEDLLERLHRAERWEEIFGH